MPINPRGSFSTLLLISFLLDVSGAPVSGRFKISGNSAFAAANPEITRLEDEVAAAQNALDAEILKGAKASGAVIKTKTRELEEKTRALKEHVEKSMLRKTGTAMPSSGKDTDSENENRAEETKEPETVLSGDGIPSEIRYSKKSKAGATEKPKPTASENTPPEEDGEPQKLPDAGTGLSEIQYPKKKPSPKR